MIAEYCEIHVDLSKTSEDIKIFSKNGKDATADRGALHRYKYMFAFLIHALIRTAPSEKLYASAVQTVRFSSNA